MPDEPKSPLSTFTEHAKAIFGIAAAVAGAVFGTAHWAFYEQLDVRPSDVGLGPAEILSQAAIGLALASLFCVALVLLLASIYWIGWSTSADVAKTPTPLDWAEALGIGVVGAAAMAAGTVGGTFAVWVWGDAAVSVVLVAVVAGTFYVYREGWRDRRQATAGELEPMVRRRIATIGAIGFAVLVVVMAALVAVDDARLVRRGVVPASLLHPLVGGPVTCVEPKPAKASTRYLLHLGTGDTHEVLYRPGHGPVRVPAGDVVLLPADASKCRPSP